MSHRVTCIGLAVLLLHSFCATGWALTIQADQAQVKTVGGVQGNAWNLWSNGDWADFVHFASPGTYRVRVTCFGSPVEKVWPEMAFSIDGVIASTVTVASNTPAEYAFRFEAESGDHRIGVSFLNDALTRTEDRNLYIVSMSTELVVHVAR